MWGNGGKMNSKSPLSLSLYSSSHISSSIFFNCLSLVVFDVVRYIWKQITIMFNQIAGPCWWERKSSEMVASFLFFWKCRLENKWKTTSFFHFVKTRKHTLYFLFPETIEMETHNTTHVLLHPQIQLFGLCNFMYLTEQPHTITQSSIFRFLPCTIISNHKTEHVRLHALMCTHLTLTLQAINIL